MKIGEIITAVVMVLVAGISVITLDSISTNLKTDSVHTILFSMIAVNLAYSINIYSELNK